MPWVAVTSRLADLAADLVELALALPRPRAVLDALARAIAETSPEARREVERVIREWDAEGAPPGQAQRAPRLAERGIRVTWDARARADYQRAGLDPARVADDAYELAQRPARAGAVRLRCRVGRGTDVSLIADVVGPAEYRVVRVEVGRAPSRPRRSP